MHTYIYPHMYIHIYIHVHKHVCMHMHIYVYIYVYMYLMFLSFFFTHRLSHSLTPTQIKFFFIKEEFTLERTKLRRIKTLSIQIHTCTPRINIRRCYQNIEYTHSYIHTFELKSKVRGKASFRDFGPSNAGHGKEWRSFAN